MYKIKNSIMKFQIRKDLFVWFFVLIVMAAMAIGDVEQEPLIARTDENVDEANIEISNDEIGFAEDGKIQSISFKKNVGIRDALRFLAVRYQKNIIPSQNVDGVVGITNLYNVTFKQALESILGYGFKYEMDEDFIKIYTAEEYKKIREDTDRMSHKIFTLYYISAAEARKLITSVLSKNGKIEATTAAVTGVPTSATISSDSGGGDTIATNDIIIVYDYPENIAKIEEVVAMIDIRPKQVLIEATILSATLTEDMQFGIDWSTLSGTFSGIGDITKGASDYVASAGTSQVSLSGGMSVGFAHDNIAGFIRAIEKVSDVTILANPKILAINKQLGQVYIGSKIGYRDNSQSFDTGATLDGEVKFLETGTKLSFRPYIGNDGYIRMDIHPKDSSGTLVEGVPNEDSAELVTNIMVKDGQTIVIGGLLRNKITTGRTQIPILGDIPILGVLFRGTADKTERQEVIVLLTPHIIDEPSQVDGIARAKDVKRLRNSAKDELQWQQRARLAEDHYAKAAKLYLDGDYEAAMDALNIALMLRPTYLEAIKLKEKIMIETDPDHASKIERMVLDSVEQKETAKWRRR